MAMAMATGQSAQSAQHLADQEPLSQHCELIIRQGPENARVAVGKEKDRKPIDPPPIVQLKISQLGDPGQNYVQSPYLFMSCSLLPESGKAKRPTAASSLGATLAGTLVSSLYRLRDTSNLDSAFFIFGDLSVKHEGKFRLQFTLYEMRDSMCVYIGSVTSNRFPVHSAKNFPGMKESTFLTRSFCDQGVRLRLRKEPRTLLRKRGPADDDYEPRHYRQGNRQPSTGGYQQNVAALEPPEHQRRDSKDQGEYNEAQASWGQRPTPNRLYSQQSTASFQYSSSNSCDDYPSAKRSRTGSDQSQSSVVFGQILPDQLDTISFASRPYPDDQQSHYNQYASTQPGAYGNYPYTQSPQSANSNHPTFFSDRTGSTGIPSPFEPNMARSPQEGHFPPQPQAVPYGSMGSMSSQLPYSMSQSLVPLSTLQFAQHVEQSMSIGPISPGYDTPMNYGMPPLVPRLTMNPVCPGFPPSILARRGSYQPFPSSGTNPNMSPGNTPGLFSQA